jgi:hypothetical protein
MPISVVCNSCNSKLNAPDAAAGKSVKCPKCKASLTVPAAAEPAFEVVDDPAPPKSELPPKKKTVVVEDDADDADDAKEKTKAKKKPRPTDDDEDEDDAEEKPKKKKKKKVAAVSSGNMARNIIGGVVLLVAVGIAGFVWYDRSQKVKETDTANNGASPTPVQPPQPGQNPLTQPGPITQPGKNTPTQSGQTPPVDNSPPISATSEVLVKSYFQGQGEFDSKHKGKLLVVEGTLEDVSVNIFKESEVFFKLKGGTHREGDAKTQSLNINCRPTAPTVKSLWLLSRGQKIKIRGRYEKSGRVVEGSEEHYIQITDCSLEEVGADPSLQLDIPEFAKRRAGDPEEFDLTNHFKEFTLKNVHVESVIKMDGRDAGVIVVDRAAKGGTKLKVTWISYGEKQFPNVKVGGILNVKGRYRNFNGELLVMDAWVTE